MVLAGGSVASRYPHAEAKRKSRAKKSREANRGSNFGSVQSSGFVLPPGPVANELVAPPPGLEFFAASGGGPARTFHANSADSAVSATAVAKVRIRGLPSALVNDVMIEAILEQAKIDSAVVDHATTPGFMGDEVMICFSTEKAATQCVRHFEGRHWGAPGAAVQCEIIPVQPSVVPDKERSLEPIRLPEPTRLLEPARIPVAPWLSSAKVLDFQNVVSRPTTVFNAEAPAFVPMGAQRLDDLQKTHMTYTMSTIARSELSTDEDTNHCVSDDDGVLPAM